MAIETPDEYYASLGPIEKWLPPVYDGDLSPEELEYLSILPEWLKPYAEWELRDEKQERLCDFVNYFRNKARGR